MLLQAIIGVGLETLEDFCISSLNLTISLWVSNRRIANLDAKIFAVSLEGTAGKLGPVVSGDPIWDHKPIDHGFDKLQCGLFVDLDHRGPFWPLCEFVDGDVEVPVPFDCPREWT
jgi:hypothetical protein